MRGQIQFDFFARGAVGVENKFDKKVGGGAKHFFFITSVGFLFFKWEGKTGRGDDPGQLKKIQAGWAHGGF